jgi:hypothetical protein
VQVMKTYSYKNSEQSQPSSIINYIAIQAPKI